eukprot:4643774-Ditylum_brightwellii.AAC.1
MEMNHEKASKKAWFMAKSIRQNKQQIGNSHGNLHKRPGTVTEVKKVDNLKSTKHYFTTAQRTESCAEMGQPE